MTSAAQVRAVSQPLRSVAQVVVVGDGGGAEGDVVDGYVIDGAGEEVLAGVLAADVQRLGGVDHGLVGDRAGAVDAVDVHLGGGAALGDHVVVEGGGVDGCGGGGD